MTDRASAASPQGPSIVDPLIGRVIGDRFRITDVLARGGMGKIYRAEQTPLGRICALKVLSPSSPAGEHDGEFHKRFFLEASIASKLTHPNTVTIFDYGRTEDDIYYMAMEYLEGSTLQRAIRAAGFFPEDRATHIVRQICRALREAHSLGVIHRDLKPANIFLVEHGDEADFVKVLDFGLVKNLAETPGEELTRVGVFVGSPKYMSPEQIRGERVDGRTDIYALGTILYEMVAGKVPFVRASAVHVMVAQVNEPPPPLRQTNPNVQVSAALEETIMRCLAKDPEQRLRSMDEMLACLKRSAGPHVLSGSGTGDTRAAAGMGFDPLDGTGSGPTAGLPAISPSGSRPTPLLSSQAPPLQVPLAQISTGTSAFAPPQTGSSPPHAPPARTSAFTEPPPSFPPPSAASKPPAPPPTPISVPISKPPPTGSKNARLFAALAASILVGAVSTFFALRPSASTKGDNESAVAAPHPTAAETVAPPRPVEPAAIPSLTGSVMVRINTDPDGAEVRENGTELCGSTPCDVPFEGPDDPSLARRLTVSRPGYRTEVRPVRVGDSPVIIRMTKTVDPTHAP